MLYKADFFSLVVYAYSPSPLPPPTAFTEPKRAQTVLNIEFYFPKQASAHDPVEG